MVKEKKEDSKDKTKKKKTNISKQKKETKKKTLETTKKSTTKTTKKITKEPKEKKTVVKAKKSTTAKVTKTVKAKKTTAKPQKATKTKESKKQITPKKSIVKKIKEKKEKPVKTIKKETKEVVKEIPKKETKEIKKEPPKKRFVYRKNTREVLKSRKKYKKLKEKELKQTETEVSEPKDIITVNETLTVKDLALKLEVGVNVIIKQLMDMRVMATINQRLNFDIASIVALEYGKKLELIPLYGDKEAEEEEVPGNLVSRPPVITIMGHVDHGKTSILDVIRETDIVSKEAGGITQHMGAYRVKTSFGELMFLDTPGHEAFTAMRARGVQVTDIAVIVVAADDGIMPQTVEAIDHAKIADVPIIVAINKVDLPGANVEKVKQHLAEHDLSPEDWGGKTICVEVSAKNKTGIDNLVQMLLLQAEMMELKADAKGRARGIVVEAKLDKQKGSTATVLIQKGTLNLGDSFVSGNVYGKVKAMHDDRSKNIASATPSIPAEILGFNGVPLAGDKFVVVENEKEARIVAENRKQMVREEKVVKKKHITLEDVHKEMLSGKIKDLKIIIKADVQGSVEALKDSLERMSNDEIRLAVIHSGVGAIVESDVMLAAASNAIIISFNNSIADNIRQLAEKEAIDIKSYNIIYEVINDVKLAMEGMLEPDIKKVVTGKAEVKMLINIPKIGLICGCKITEGKAKRDDFVSLYREDQLIYTGKLKSLKRFKEDVKEVDKGYECGIALDKYTDFKENDILEFFHEEKVTRKLNLNDIK